MSSRNRIIYSALSMVFLGFSAYFAFNHFYVIYDFVRSEFPYNTRVSASLVVTQHILDGTNPFSLEAQPQALYNFGFIYPYIVFPLAALLGNGYLPHKLIAIFSVFILIFFNKTRADSHII